MYLANEELRERMKSQNIPLWKVAVEIGVHESTLIRWLRFPLSDSQKNKVEMALALIEGRANNGV